MASWHAQMITPDTDRDTAPLLRKEFRLDTGHGPLTRGTLRQSFLGIGETLINGAPASDEVLAPGWSSYEWRLRYRTLDVTRLITPTSVIGVALGNGWYRGYLSWNGKSAFYGTELAAWIQLDLTFQDGHTQTVVSDDSWQSGPSAVLADDLYNGQRIDARLRDPRCWQPGFAAAEWSGVRRVDFDPAKLTPAIAPPIIRQEAIPPTRIWTSPAGRTLLDFGQNLVGWLELTVRGEAGREITVRQTEVLENDELGVRPLRTARATDHFVLSGEHDTFEPTFTFHGFRYAEIVGWPGDVDPNAVRAVVIGSDLRRTGQFACSDPLLNQLHENVVWGTRGNFVDVPTDCPQRDERLGWTGDIAVFAPTAGFLFDVKDFLRDWLLDLTAEQNHQDGKVPFVVPDVLKYEEHPTEFPEPETTAIWSDAAVWVPWALWQAYGDPAVLADQYGSMASHTRRIRSLLSENGLWDSGFQFGDWLDPQAPPDKPFRASADNGVVATACAYRTATLTAQTAQLLGHTADSEEFAGMAAGLREAFTANYVTDGVITSDCSTVYTLAIAFDVLDPEDRRLAGTRLAELVRANDFRVSTGFAGTPYITGALADTDHLDDAYRLLLEQGCPSWLYPVTMGATTIWERWDSMLPDDSINPGEMTSFNHYALGSVADWMHSTLGGLSALEPGYRTILVAPRPGGDLTWAKTSLDTPHGHAAVGWRLDAGELIVDVTVPAGCSAVLRLPGQADRTLPVGEHRVTAPVLQPAAG